AQVRRGAGEASCCREPGEHLDSALGSSVMRLTDLWDATVKTLDGEKLGRVHEVHAEGGRVVALTCGPGSFIERLTARKHGRRVPWECVVRSEEHTSELQSLAYLVCRLLLEKKK